MVRETSPFQDAFTYQIWHSYLKEYNRYAPHMNILKTRSEVKVKVTVTRKVYRRYAPDSMSILETRSEVKVSVIQGWCMTLRLPKMHAHTKCCIPVSNNMRDMLRTTNILKTRSEVQVTVIQEWYRTLRLPKMHAHTKCGIPTSNNMSDMLRTRIF